MECIVCYDNDNIFKIDCSHTYCFYCIRKIIEINPQCAYCRRKLDLLSILNIYKSSVPIVKRSDIFKIMEKIIQEEASYYLTKISKEYNTLKTKLIYLKKLCSFLYKNRYYIHSKNSYRLIDTIILKLKEFYFKQDIDEAYEWYFKFREYRDSLLTN